MLAEDAIKSAIKDYQQKQNKVGSEGGKVKVTA
jgi:NifU-like protein involved in Fe-S cluster formation